MSIKRGDQVTCVPRRGRLIQPAQFGEARQCAIDDRIHDQPGLVCHPTNALRTKLRRARACGQEVLVDVADPLAVVLVCPPCGVHWPVEHHHVNSCTCKLEERVGEICAVAQCVDGNACWVDGLHDCEQIFGSIESREESGNIPPPR